ncbi:YceI family protein [Nevskia soli]|uniref:YceI family protein n=1 Tax=Nevskia soli TaxID=418856 RepID=UPI0015D6A740|nr:YceI family protein [Nevskia soli]
MSTSYKIDPAHSSAQFVVRHLMITNVRGAFSGVTGTVVWDDANPSQSTIDAIIDATTLSTQDATRDGHVKSPDFLDVAQYPTIEFKSSSIAPAGDGELTVKGDLTLHGVTKPVTLKVEGPTPESKDPYGNLRIGASATTKIKRSDFGLVWNAPLETGGFALSDELKIELELSLIKS